MRETLLRRLVEFVRRRPIVTLVVTAAFVYVLVIFGPALLLGIKHGFSSQKIEKQKEAAETEKTAAHDQIIQAGEIEAERQAEDRHREQKLRPARDGANISLAEARERRKAAEKRYDQIRKDPPQPGIDDLALRLRNCTDLATLYPGLRFAGCH